MEEWNGEELQKRIDGGDRFCLYMYTPLCGTCQVASKMLLVIEELLPDAAIGKSNANYIEQTALKYQVESVPCLLFFKHGELTDKLYAFQSVPYLLERLKKHFAEEV
ncbi:thioredoxin family protein [Bacillus testis]|uniref:thioredoxin family protein n=1 Tax=Bacillus testis TaxID=1622072 RepID=UPI00067EBA34|nr:thioredoxin family protein [Bacillus testis]